MGQVYFGKPGTSDCGIHFPCTAQECTCDNVAKANQYLLSNFWLGVEIRTCDKFSLMGENCKLSFLKVVAFAYKRWLLMRGSNYIDLTGELLVCSKSGRLREVVARGGSTVVSEN